MSELLAGLTYPEALAALQRVAEQVADKNDMTVEDLEIALAERAEEQNIAIPVIAGVDLDWAHHGPKLIEILRPLLGSDDDLLRETAQTAVLDVKGKGQAQEFVAATITVGAVIFAIGLLSKIEYSADKGLTIEKGFPELEKVPKLVKAFLTGRTA